MKPKNFDNMFLTFEKRDKQQLKILEERAASCGSLLQENQSQVQDMPDNLVHKLSNLHIKMTIILVMLLLKQSYAKLLLLLV